MGDPYATVTKVIVGQAQNGISTTTGTLAEKINNYIETLDDDDNTILWFEVEPLKGHTVQVTIVSEDL